MGRCGFGDERGWTKLLGPFSHVRRGTAHHWQFLQSATRNKHRRQIESGFARRLKGIRTPLVPMNGVFAKLLPRLFETLLALKPTQRFQLVDRARDGVPEAFRVHGGSGGGEGPK